MSNIKPNYFQRRSKPQGPRANERIKALDVQVIGSDGDNLGSMPLGKAIQLAKNESLDLIEYQILIPLFVKLWISVNINMIYKKPIKQKNKKLFHKGKLRPGTETHDYNLRLRMQKVYC